MGSGKTKISGRITYIKKDEYKKFIEKYPNSDVTYEEFITILKESNNYIKEQILDNQLGFKLPHNLGYIAVNKFKTSRKFVAIDWVNTKKLGKIVPLTNFHSFGHAYRIMLYKNAKVKPLQAYHMDAHRLLKRALAQNIKQDKQQYIAINKSYYNKRFSIDNYLKQK